MNRNRKLALGLTLVSLTSLVALSAPVPTLLRAAPPPVLAVDPSPVHAPGRIQFAICLDTSGSMSGLIQSARAKLWSIVSDLATARPQPQLQIAVLSFGNDGLDPENGWVSVVCPLTEDLDKVSEALFALTTSGGTELVGRVLHTALEQLAWDPAESTLKLAFVAGNESADQDAAWPFREVCRRAIERGIQVNSVYCTYSGDAAEIAAGWREVATLADGHFAAIDQESGAFVMAAPQDAELVALSARLNETYVPFGLAGRAAWENQCRQDANASGAGAGAERAAAKATSNYVCSSWDLVDALDAGQVELEDVPAEDLPEALAKLSIEERASYLDAKRTQRKELQGQIQTLQAERARFIATEQARLAAEAGSQEDTFDVAVRRAVRAQAEAKGFHFTIATAL